MMYIAVAADVWRQKRECGWDVDSEVYAFEVIRGQDETSFAEGASTVLMPDEVDVGIWFCLGFVDILEETLLESHLYLRGEQGDSSVISMYGLAFLRAPRILCISR